jgi:DNA polymerase-4
VLIAFVGLPRFCAQVEAHTAGNPAEPTVVHRRGSVVSVSPAAEGAGLAVGMQLREAHAVCPEATCVGWEEGRYDSAWRQVLEICTEWASPLEPVGLGEVFFELARVRDPAALLGEIARSLSDRTGLACSAGAGPSKLVARVVAGRGEALTPGVSGPHSLRNSCGTDRPAVSAVTADEAAGFLAPLPASCLWPLDEAMRERLEILGITTVGLLQQMPCERLAEQFGGEARRLARLARGIDDSPVRPLYPPRRIAARRSWAEGLRDGGVIESHLQELCREIAIQLVQRAETCRRLSLRVEAEEGDPQQRSANLHRPTLRGRELLRACRRLLSQMQITAPVTALSVEVRDFAPHASAQLGLFDHTAVRAATAERATEAVAVVHEQFGGRAVLSGREVNRSRRERVLAALAPSAT